MPSSTALDLAVEDVGLADEVGDEGVGRRVVEFARRAVLRDHRIVHDDDAVGDGQRLFLVVRDVDHGQPELLLDLADLLAHMAAQLGVEVGERLVEQQHLRLQHQRARHRDALLLAAGQLAGQPVAEAGQADQFQPGIGAAGDFLLGEAGEAQAVCDILASPSCAETARRTGTPWTRRGRSPAAA